MSNEKLVNVIKPLIITSL